MTVAAPWSEILAATECQIVHGWLVHNERAFRLADVMIFEAGVIESDDPEDENDAPIYLTMRGQSDDASRFLFYVQKNMAELVVTALIVAAHDAQWSLE